VLHRSQGNQAFCKMLEQGGYRVKQRGLNRQLAELSVNPLESVSLLETWMFFPRGLARIEEPKLFSLDCRLTYWVTSVPWKNTLSARCRSPGRPPALNHSRDGKSLRKLCPKKLCHLRGAPTFAVQIETKKIRQLRVSHQHFTEVRRRNVGTLLI